MIINNKLRTLFVLALYIGFTIAIYAIVCHFLKIEFHEGMNTGIFGNLFELFQNREAFDLYVCPKCGKVEFFVPLDREREFKVE